MNILVLSLGIYISMNIRSFNDIGSKNIPPKTQTTEFTNNCRMLALKVNFSRMKKSLNREKLDYRTQLRRFRQAMFIDQ